MKHRGVAISLAAGVLVATTLAFAQHQHGGHDAQSAHAMAEDHRTPVKFPPQLRAHTLINMRDHLLALAQIQDALAAGAYDEAASIAEQRLGMSSLISYNFV